MQSRGSAGSRTTVSYVSSRRHRHLSMAFRGPLSLLWLALSVGTGPAACFVVLPTSTRVAAAAPLPKIVLASRQGAHGVSRSRRSDGGGNHNQRRLFGFTRRFEQERGGGEEEQEVEEREETDTATGVGSAPAAHRAVATSVRTARALLAAAGPSRGRVFGFRGEAAPLKASSATGETEEESATGGSAPAAYHGAAAGVRKARALVAMIGLGGKGSRATATALKASATGADADVAPPETSTARPKKILIIMSDTGGGHRASSQALSAALENLYGDQVRVGIAQRW